jgi:hypothetical protein
MANCHQFGFDTSEVTGVRPSYSELICNDFELLAI